MRMNNNVKIASLGEDYDYATVFIDRLTDCAFGPVIHGDKYHMSHAFAHGFMTFMNGKYPGIDISTIPTERLSVYYKEFRQKPLSYYGSKN